MKYKLPVMQCDTGCGKCCGPVLCNEQEFAQARGYAANRGIEPIDQGVTCPFFQRGTCAVYEARPFVCRMFGHTESLVCCKGYNANVSERIERELKREYYNRGEPGRWLHEVLGLSPDAIMRRVVQYMEADAAASSKD